MITRNQALVKLKKAHTSQRAAAEILDVTFTHLNLVLNGHRHSASLLRRIIRMPTDEMRKAAQERTDQLRREATRRAIRAGYRSKAAA